MVLRGEPREVVALPRLDDDLRDRASCGVPVLLLTRERLLDHLVGDVGRQPLEGGFGRLVFPEPEKGAHDLGDCEHGEQKRHDRREHARHGDSNRRARAHDRALAAGGCRSLRSPGRCLADGRMPGLRGSALTEGPRLGMLCGPFQRAFRLRGGSSLLGGGMPCDDGACAAEGVARLSDAGELLGVVRLGRGGIGDRALEVPLGLGGEAGFHLRPARTDRGGFGEVRPAPPRRFALR